MTEPKTYELIITEKPRVSLRIAQSLAEGKLQTKKEGRVSYYILKHSGKDIVIAPAVGHVFTLKKIKRKAGYPVFDIHWVESYLASRGAFYTKPYIDILKKLAPNAKSFVSATDYDIEGELIGYNVLKYICGEAALKKARRMKFSALTKEELVKAYEKPQAHVDFNLANAGIARHTLDWFWGMNTSRALSYAYKTSSGYSQIISAGRVQTPTLKILEDKEKEIKKFKPTPFWVLAALIETPKKEILAIHEAEKFQKENEADTAFKNAKDKKAVVESITSKRSEQKPPTPFNLGDLQMEAYKIFKFTPQRTQQIAQTLYEAGLISYPRTSSQKFTGVDLKSILTKLSEIENYKATSKKLLSEPELKPNEGEKTDPAHPCVYPTGEKPEKIHKQDLQLYDLITKRFFATFGKPAIREIQTVIFNIGNEKFVAKGSLTIEKNWHTLYAPYARVREEELPKLEEKKSYKVKDLQKERKETQPPSRYNAASIIKKMEELGIGTKATRAPILQTLYDRNYIHGQQIKVTSFGSKIAETLIEYAPELTSEEMTKKFEEELEQIQEGKQDKDKVIEEAKQALVPIMEKFRANEEKIGKRLVASFLKARKEQAIIGKCPNCSSDLIIRVSRASHKQFIGCSSYPKCTTGFPLPQVALIIRTEKVCPHDKLPVIQVVRKGKRRFEMCISPACESKKDWGKNNNKKEEKKEETAFN